MSYRSASKRRRYSRARSYKRNFSRSRIPSASRRKLRAVANLRTGGMIGIEKKFFDTKYNAASGTVGPVTAPAVSSDIANSTLFMDSVQGSGSGAGVAKVYWLNCPAVGSASYQRDGRVIRNHSIEISGLANFNHNNTALPDQAFLMLALVLDTQANGASPAATGANIYKDLGGGIALPYRNMSDTTRYRVLSFKRIRVPHPVVTPGTAGGQSNVTYTTTFKMYRKLGFKTNFKTDKQVAAPDAIVDNGLFLMAWDNSNYGYNLYLSARLRFTG